ncbi:hypothetical protein Lal_00038384 [Lupinus albus]|uniref:Uncharacterized protein n=1 Tax=Lupinus albus TaxID=3870 RepID=A0A6A5NMB6_LUPAL|nr:hypothetical protein Lalb_Chr19g0123891 [Lupinus albus]KAF1883890.1 hypothetical protein Lal_00038384 [Lupinus albus]
MAYRRKQGMAKVSTLQEDFDFDFDSDGINVAHTSSSIKAFQDHDPQRSKSFDAYGGLGRDEAKGGFWGVLAHKAKSIIDDNKSSQQHHILHQSTSSNTPPAPTSQFKPLLYHQPDSNRKIDNPKFRKGLDAITSSLNQLGDTFEKAFEEGRTIVENKTADLRSQMRRKGNVPEDSNQASDVRNPGKQPSVNTNTQSSHETQLKASRDVAMATTAKAKLLVRELKTVKADLAFAKARCTQLEEENKLLRDREGSDKGHSPQNDDDDDDDLIRLQLETLVAEKARLANENEIYSRENRFLREIVEYHQLTMQDVVYLDEGIEEVTHIYPIHSSSLSSPPSPHDEEVPPMLIKEDSNTTSKHEVSPSVTPSHHTK